LTSLAWILLGASAIIAALFLVPRLLIGRAQDQLARTTMARDGKTLKLVTRAELVIGKFQRIPGLLSWRDDVLVFQGIDGHTETIPPSRINKIVTADRMGSGRLLVKLEVLRFTDSEGEELEFVVARNSADAWRKMLGDWAGRQRLAETVAPETPNDLVTPR
jgi:hypothetical protein